MLNAALEGSLVKVEYTTNPIFGFEIPRTCDGVPPEVLDPSSSWSSSEAFLDKYRQLAMRFIDNFRKFAPDCTAEVVETGTVL